MPELIDYPVSVFPWKVTYQRFVQDPGDGVHCLIYAVSRDEAERWAAELYRYAPDIGNVQIVDRLEETI